MPIAPYCGIKRRSEYEENETYSRGICSGGIHLLAYEAAPGIDLHK